MKFPAKPSLLLSVLLPALLLVACSNQNAPVPAADTAATPASSTPSAEAQAAAASSAAAAGAATTAPDAAAAPAGAAAAGATAPAAAIPGLVAGTDYAVIPGGQPFEPRNGKVDVV
jgi:thiol:disulfide interchange protein DsbA